MGFVLLVLRFILASIPSKWPRLIFENVLRLTSSTSHQDPSSRNPDVFARNYNEVDPNKGSKPDAILRHPLLPRATGASDSSSRVINRPSIHYQSRRPIDRFDGAQARPPGTPTQVNLPAPIQGIPRALPPIESIVVGHIAITAGIPEVGARGKDGAITSLDKDVRISNLCGQGGIVFYGRTRPSLEGRPGVPFLTAIRFNMYDPQPVNDGILQAVHIGRVATITLIAPYTQTDQDHAVAQQYADQLELAMLRVFPSAKFTGVRTYGYDPPTQGQAGVQVYNFMAYRNGEMNYDRRFVPNEDIPQQVSRSRGAMARLRRWFANFGNFRTAHFRAGGRSRQRRRPSGSGSNLDQ